ncbi:MAG TPA: hypothetical protein VMH41_06780 [Mycobacteriales bacterium]|nr:hypothetical protein [Mycobacteriales bacterium]
MPTSPVMQWLADGLPITLICDLVSTSDPDSGAINSTERPAHDPIWRETSTTVDAGPATATG